MAKTGYGADATLVGAAFNLGRSNIPHDTSKIFQQQFKAIEEMNISQMATAGNIGLAVGEGVKKYGEITKSCSSVER